MHNWSLLLRLSSLLHESLHLIGVLEFLDCLKHHLVQVVFKFALKRLNFFFLLAHDANAFLDVAARELAILTRFLTKFMSAHGVTSRSNLCGGFTSEQVLHGEDFIKKLELLFGFLPFLLIQLSPIKLFNVLESVDDERRQRITLQNLIVVNSDLLNCV